MTSHAGRSGRLRTIDCSWAIRSRACDQQRQTGEAPPADVVEFRSPRLRDLCGLVFRSACIRASAPGPDLGNDGRRNRADWGAKGPWTIYKDESGFTAKDTEWHRVTCFNGLGRVVAEHAAKGMLVSVRGRIHNSKWTDKEGIDRYGYEIIADDVQFLGRPKQPGETPGNADEDEDLPI